ncbi:MAG: tetratricopeptide repeat protein [Chloroflexota bacterium]|nr:tetratricopeptide repeat protein [Chloroflexota bacterium]
MRLCAFLGPDAIAEEILTADASVLGPVLAPVASDAVQRNQAIEALRAYSLMRRDPSKRMLSLHRLVQAVLQDTLEQEERRTWAERALLVITASFPSPEHATWSLCERLLTQAMVGTQIIDGYQIINEKAALFLYEVASYFHGRARYRSAEPLYRRALHIYEQALGSEHPSKGSTLHALATLAQDQGKYAEAEPLYRRALHIYEQALGPEHPDVAYPLNHLALLYSDQGKYSEAEPLSQRALRIREQNLGPEHPLIGQTRRNYAFLLRKMGRDADAQKLEEVSDTV